MVVGYYPLVPLVVVGYYPLVPVLETNCSLPSRVSGSGTNEENDLCEKTPYKLYGSSSLSVLALKDDMYGIYYYIGMSYKNILCRTDFANALYW